MTADPLPAHASRESQADVFRPATARRFGTSRWSWPPVVPSAVAAVICSTSPGRRRCFPWSTCGTSVAYRRPDGLPAGCVAPKARQWQTLPRDRVLGGHHPGPPPTPARPTRSCGQGEVPLALACSIRSPGCSPWIGLTVARHDRGPRPRNQEDCMKLEAGLLRLTIFVGEERPVAPSSTLHRDRPPGAPRGPGRCERDEGDRGVRRVVPHPSNRDPQPRR